MNADWWYPVITWWVIIASVARRLLTMIGWTGFRPGPAWIPPLLGAVALAPISGLPLGRWLYGLSGGFSIPFILLLLDDTLSPLLRRPILDDWERRAGAWFGVSAAATLYPLALGLGPFDPYSLGWQIPAVYGMVSFIAALLAAIGNRFSLVILAAGIAWHAGFLESENAWDYLVDPIYGAVAALALVTDGAGSLVARRRKPSLPKQPIEEITVAVGRSPRVMPYAR